MPIGSIGPTYGRCLDKLRVQAEALGLARPPVDDALIARYVARARDRSAHEPTAPSSP